MGGCFNIVDIWHVNIMISLSNWQILLRYLFVINKFVKKINLKGNLYVRAYTLILVPGEEIGQWQMDESMKLNLICFYLFFNLIISGVEVQV